MLIDIFCFVASYTCGSAAEKAFCHKLDGICDYLVDGYYIVSSLCLAIGFLVVVFYVQHQSRLIERLPDRVWKLEQRNA